MNNNYSGIYYDDLRFSTKEINQNFKIKVSGTNNGRRIHQLVGVSGLINLIEDTSIINNMLDKAFSKGLDKVECKLRRGLKITFYTF